MMSPRQCSAGRALLRWNQKLLATNARVSEHTVRSFEHGLSVLPETRFRIKTALERGGVIFLTKAKEGICLR
jgi:DNA-binding XRE family transcriptional regulator